jgi:hypothetical protein
MLQALKINDYEQLGKLIKTWALSEDRILATDKDKTIIKNANNGQLVPIEEFLPYPADNFNRFCDLLVKSGAVLRAHMDEWRLHGPQHQTVKFVQTTDNTLYIRLPMAQMVREREAGFKTGTDYPLPPFYSDTFFAGAQFVDPPTLDKKEKAHRKRIGDYTLSQCG